MNSGRTWDRGPTSIFFLQPKVELMGKTRSSISPEKKINHKITTFVRPQLVDEETHIARANRETKGSISEENDVEVLSNSSQTSSQKAALTDEGSKRNLARPKDATNQNSTLMCEEEKATRQ
jgi:hypothetical protein